MRKWISASGAIVISTLGFAALAASASRPVAAARPAAAADATPAPAAAVRDAAAASIARGRYLVQITGCNDCHTAGYAERSGEVEESAWLTGVPVGFRGPWGVSYPANLRRSLQPLTEEQWLPFARAQRLPPMPWLALRDMSDADLRDLYRYIRSLGPAGEATPAAAAPGAPVATPVIDFVPQMPVGTVAAR